jgi:hypothetical protein
VNPNFKECDMISDDELGQRLSCTDPARAVSPSDDALDSLLRDTRGDIPAVAPRRRRRLVTGVALAGVILAGSAAALPAAAGVLSFLAQTDWKCTWGSECGDPEGQWIDTAEADFVDYTATVFPYDLPLPPGVDAEELRITAANQMHNTPALKPEIGVIHHFESQIYCAWVGEWLQRDNAGDLTARAVASKVMIQNADWPATVATDGGGITEVQRALGHAALNGDRESVLMAAQWSACDSADGKPHPKGERLIEDVLMGLGIE